MAISHRVSGRLTTGPREQDHTVGLKGQGRGRALSMALEAMEGAFPGSDLVVTDTLTDQDHVAIHFAVGANRAGKERAPAGGILIYRIAEDSIAEHWLQPGAPDLSPSAACILGGNVS